MTKKQNIALLPQGLKDLLPSESRDEYSVVESLMKTFHHFGYEIVKPPLVEFEESMFANVGRDLRQNMFQFIDPLSKKTLFIRSDMTIQMARIATSRMKNNNRPLRLSYQGEILRVQGNQLRPERQFTQAGFELIGIRSHYADIEVIGLAIESLKKTGINNLSIDITLPNLIPIVTQGMNLSKKDSIIVRELLDRKDLVRLKDIITKEKNKILSLLVKAVGPLDNGLDILYSLDLGKEVKSILNSTSQITSAIKKNFPDVDLTIDPSESRGFEYHDGLSFTVFARDVRGELGRGGRYTNSNGESCSGFSVYLDSVMRAVNISYEPKRVLVTPEINKKVLNDLHNQGWVTVSTLENDLDLKKEAIRFSCSYFIDNNKPKPV